VIVKADTLGSLEALIGLLSNEGIKIKKASIGNITKKDLAEASSESKTENKAILGFNVKIMEEDSNIKIITNEVIYKIIEDYQEWITKTKKKEEEKQLDQLPRPVKIKIMRGCIFRQSNPCVVGVQIEKGILKSNTKLMKADGSKASYAKSLQHDGESVSQAESGKEIAVSIPDLTVGRQITEEDTLYSNLSESEFRELKKKKKLLKKEEIEILKEISEIKRKNNPMWGV
jgi:translation initiation factor 5B